MDVVILAAGRGSRLDGIAAPFWKPMMVVNGAPLIVTVVRQAGEAADGNRVVLVVSPENAQPICQLLESAWLEEIPDIVVQPAPVGPGDALLRAGPLLGKRVLQLCADNVTPDADLRALAACTEPLVVGVREIENQAEAERFTLIAEDHTFSEGVGAAGMRWADGKYRAWLGPIVADAPRLLDAVREAEPVRDEKKIGPALSAFSKDCLLLPVDCYDIGVPGEWTA